MGAALSFGSSPKTTSPPIDTHTEGQLACLLFIARSWFQSYCSFEILQWRNIAVIVKTTVWCAKMKCATTQECTTQQNSNTDLPALQRKQDYKDVATAASAPNELFTKFPSQPNSRFNHRLMVYSMLAVQGGPRNQSETEQHWGNPQLRVRRTAVPAEPAAPPHLLPPTDRNGG